jgi:arsenate reductase
MIAPALCCLPMYLWEIRPACPLINANTCSTRERTREISRAAAGDVLGVAKAGSKPAGHVHPLANRAMAEIGIDISAHVSRHMDDFLRRPVETATPYAATPTRPVPCSPGR